MAKLVLQGKTHSHDRFQSNCYALPARERHLLDKAPS